MRKVFCKCEICGSEFMGNPGDKRCIDHREKSAAVDVPAEFTPVAAVVAVQTGSVDKLCSICKSEPRAPWSNSYGKKCYAAWRKKRRELKK